MKNLEYYLNLPYKIELKKIPLDEGGGWAAFMPELNSVSFFLEMEIRKKKPKRT